MAALRKVDRSMLLELYSGTFERCARTLSLSFLLQILSRAAKAPWRPAQREFAAKMRDSVHRALRGATREGYALSLVFCCEFSLGRLRRLGAPLHREFAAKTGDSRNNEGAVSRATSASTSSNQKLICWVLFGSS